MTIILTIDKGSPRIALGGIIRHIQLVASLSQQSVCTLIVPHLIKCLQELNNSWRLSAILDSNRLLTPRGMDVLGMHVAHETETHQQQSGYNQDSFHHNKLFPTDNLLDIVELVEGFEGREIVHIKAENLVTDLTKHRVVELEERELHTFA